MLRRTLSPLSLLCLAVLLLVAVPCFVLGGRDFYKILGLQRGANEKQIKKAYRSMSKLHHPDRHQNDVDKEDANKKFQDVAAAYEALSDKDKRRIYDQSGEEGLKQQQSNGGQQHHDPFAAMFGFGGGQQVHQNSEERRGEDIRLDLPVTLEDLYAGRVFEVQLKQQHLCSSCRGSGARKDSDIIQCTTCGGRGVVIKMHQIGPGFMQQVQQPCDVCAGKGKIIRAKCPKCKGVKVNKGTKKLDVMLEAGMADGYKIEFEHAADEHPDHAAGHVIFTVNTIPHKLFERKGNDLHFTQKITLLESLVGFTRSLPHLDGHLVSLSSRGVTQHGDVQRIVREGMPLHNASSQKGDLFIKYEVEFPKTLTKEQKAGFQRILQ